MADKAIAAKMATAPRRGLSRIEAAAKLGMTQVVFDALDIQGRIGGSKDIGGERVWDALELTIRHRATSKGQRVSMVYVVGYADFIKIGWSTDVYGRIAAIQDSAPLALTIYSVFRAGRGRELQLHRRFGKYRLRGEWFKKEGELASWIINGCLE